MHKLPLVCLILLALLPKTEALQQKKSRDGSKWLKTANRSFEVTFTLSGGVSLVRINELTKQGYLLDITVNKDTGKLSRISPSKYHRNTKENPLGVPLGVNLAFYDSGNIARRYISSGIDNGYGESEPCDWEYWYDESGKLTEKTFHKQKCLYSKGLIAFFLPPGEYYVTEPPLRLRAEPSLKAKTIGNLQKHEKVEVLDFTKERLEINGFYAPWAKVKTAKGEGWVYGGFIEPVNYGETYKKYFQNIDWQKFVEKMGLE